MAQWVEAGALGWPWPSSRLLVWGFRQALLLGSVVVCLLLWAVRVKEAFFLKFPLELEIPGGARVGGGAEKPGQRSGHLSGTAVISVFFCFSLA